MRLVECADNSVRRVARGLVLARKEEEIEVGVGESVLHDSVVVLLPQELVLP